MRTVPRPRLAPAPAIAWALLPAAAIAYALSFSWGRWGEIVVDWGRELEIAHQLAQGRALADLAYWYGPLAPYLNALLFTAFGVRTGVLQGAGLVSLLVMTSLLWAIAFRLAGPLAAALATTSFVSLCAFGHYYVNDIFNWVTPYAYPATYGMVLATTSLYALLRYVSGSGPRWLTTSLVFLALASGLRGDKRQRAALKRDDVPRDTAAPRRALQHCRFRSILHLSPPSNPLVDGRTAPAGGISRGLTGQYRQRPRG